MRETPGPLCQILKQDAGTENLSKLEHSGARTEPHQSIPKCFSGGYNEDVG